MAGNPMESKMANLFIDKRNSDTAVDEWGHEGNDTLLGSRFGDKLKGAQGNDTIHGNGGNDQIMDLTWVGFEPDFDGLFTRDKTNAVDRRIISEFASENIEIGAQVIGQALFHGGNDRFFGEDGDDFLLGLEGNDRLDGGDGLDVLIGGSGNDTMIGGEGNDIFGGGQGDDYMLGGSGADLLNGGAGNDTLEGGTGGDILIGGVGEDTVVYSQSFAGIRVNLRFGASALDTPSGSEGSGDSFESIENVIGSRFADIITGTEGGNTLFGGLGNDFLIGRDGGDELDGGAGIDGVSYDASDAGVVITLDDINAGTRSSASGGHADGDVLISIENVTGSNFADRIIGNSGTNTLTGLNGNDQLFGLDGNDRLIGGEGQDTLSGGNDDDILLGGAGSDRLDGGTGIDTVSYAGHAAAVVLRLGDAGAAGTGVSTILTSGGFAVETDVITRIDNVIGSDLSDSLEGNASANTLNGGLGDVTLVLSGGADRLDGDGGNDFLFVAQTTDSLTIDLGFRVTSEASAAIVTLVEIENVISSDGNDKIIGTAADNQITGAGGFDQLTGAGGNDTFLFRNLADIGLEAGSRDVITDFAAGDRIDFRNIPGAEGSFDVELNFIGSAAFSGEAGEIRAVVVNNRNTVIAIDFDGDQAVDARLQLSGVHALGAGDFLL
jgi:Ca2+-binding RTX toxin-like protein